MRCGESRSLNSTKERHRENEEKRVSETSFNEYAFQTRIRTRREIKIEEKERGGGAERKRGRGHLMRGHEELTRLKILISRDYTAVSILPRSLHRRGKIRNPVARMKGFSVRPTFPRHLRGSKCTITQTGEYGAVFFSFFNLLCVLFYAILVTIQIIRLHCSVFRSIHAPTKLIFLFFFTFDNIQDDGFVFLSVFFYS